MSAVAFAEVRPARGPAEADGRTRADVSLLVATRSDGELRCGPFRDLPGYLRPGDLLVVNTSATIPAAVPGRLDGGGEVTVHFSTRLPGERWVVELRGPDLRRIDRPPLGSRLDLPGGGRVELAAAYRGSDRLTAAKVHLPDGGAAYLERHGAPIRYADRDDWGLDAYQTVFAAEPGSAEMPSAGRPFSTELVTRLVSRGVLIAPVTLHAGVSSLEAGEAPFPEPYDVPAETARLVSAVHTWGRRVVAVGTTVVRALETVATGPELPALVGGGGLGPHRELRPGRGETELVVTPERGLWAVDGLITGWHEPDSSHLLMLEAACGGRSLLERSYAEAARLGFVGHEFGDAHLVLP